VALNAISKHKQTNKMSFFLITDLSALSLEDVDSVSEADRDTLAPLPPPAWNNQYPYSNNSYVPQNISFQQYFIYIVAVSFIGGENPSTWKKPPTCCKSLTNFIT
jgi:hypothetical protein